MENKILPIGTIVKLKKSTKKTVIMGLAPYDVEKRAVLYDYLGVPYPEGYLGKGSCYCFNSDSIETVVYKGYEDEERDKMICAFEKIRNEVERSMKIKKWKEEC